MTVDDLHHRIQSTIDTWKEERNALMEIQKVAINNSSAWNHFDRRARDLQKDITLHEILLDNLIAQTKDR